MLPEIKGRKEARNFKFFYKTVLDWDKVSYNFSPLKPFQDTKMITGQWFLTSVKLFCIRPTCYVSHVHGSVHRESISTTVQQDVTIYSLLCFCELFYIFRVVPPPIIRSAYTASGTGQTVSATFRYRGGVGTWSSNSTAIAEGNRNGLTSARCCNYIYMRSWWWVVVPPEICRTVHRNIINCI